jgi:hypothetical protein
MWNSSHLESLISSDIVPPNYTCSSLARMLMRVMSDEVTTTDLCPLSTLWDFNIQTSANFVFPERKSRSVNFGRMKLDENIRLETFDETSLSKNPSRHGARPCWADPGSPPLAAHTIWADQIGQHSSPLISSHLPTSSAHLLVAFL